MQDIPKRVCSIFKDARRALGLKQKALAAEIGCQQPALSMFEGGNPTKLSEELVNKLAARLGIDLKKAMAKAAAEEREPAAFEAAIGFCPEKECPSNSAYVVCGRTFYRVTLQKGRYCAHCGEVLETCCPECGAPLNEGACCVACGKQYV
jgi:transcriptional regulator with XRE-family HTH domain